MNPSSDIDMNSTVLPIRASSLQSSNLAPRGVLVREVGSVSCAWVKMSGRDRAVTSTLNGRRVLVTGATGRIGLVTVRHLTELGALVTTLSNAEHPDLKADRILIGDTRSEADVAEALTDAEFVVHLAALAHPSVGTPYDVYSINVVSTFNV